MNRAATSKGQLLRVGFEDAEAALAEMQSLVERAETPESAAVAVRAVRRRELLRIACGELVAGTDVALVGQGLSRLTDATLQATLDIATESVRRQRDLASAPSRIAVETEAGVVAQPVRAVAEPQTLQVPRGATRWLRIRILRLSKPVAAPVYGRAAISELTVQGVRATRTFRLPAPRTRSDRPISYLMERGVGRADECMPGSATWVCSAYLHRRDEEGHGFDRTFSAPAALMRRSRSACIRSQIDQA